jgi:hypothetical protein
MVLLYGRAGRLTAENRRLSGPLARGGAEGHHSTKIMMSVRDKTVGFKEITPPPHTPHQAPSAAAAPGCPDLVGEVHRHLDARGRVQGRERGHLCRGTSLSEYGLLCVIFKRY